MDIIKTEIINNITYLMEEYGVDIEKLSKLSNIDKNILQQLLSADISPSMEILTDICKIFNMSTCEFFDYIICSKFLSKCV